MSEQKWEIEFTVACVNEFAHQYHLSAQEAFAKAYRGWIIKAFRHF